MPEADRAMLIQWLEAGAPASENPPDITPSPPAPLPDDVITVKMSEPFEIPAETEDNGHRHHQDTWSFVLPLCNSDPIRLQGIGGIQVLLRICIPPPSCSMAAAGDGCGMNTIRAWAMNWMAI